MSIEVGPGPETEHHHHHHTGHKWLDVVLAVSAVFISLMSLFLAIQHGRVMERMVEANTWPYVMVIYSTANRDGTPHTTIQIENKGVGPAKIESLELFYNQVAQPNPQALLKAMLKPVDPGHHFPVLQSDVIDLVLAAREEIPFVDIHPENFTPAEYATLRQEVPKVHFRVCYCSVFDECSVLDTQVVPTRAVAVKSCPVPKVQFLH